ncbi:MAG: guanylate kinase [Rhodospirillales bacterium RIFCSPLOWO2_12_FULL_58_28]|nr:MAG: guanylate kinase [Rhodospirillales bacterium RIFCSPLOWO2_02_FULL_58_16]OHC78157.1 MAG: guanylate kinase [Rhodospirillales bacterium RIFCSPLOWO2_12_FULL_58_28]
MMLVLSSPSGAGKTTISRELLERDENLSMSISTTTRPPRPGEEDGRDYYFTSPEQFKRMVSNGEFLEHAVVFSNSYGTPRAPVETALAKGLDVLFDVDWQGTQQLAHSARHDLVSIFILPPSHQELEHRLRKRAQDTEAVVRERMSKASSEISHWDAYDYIIVNHHVRDSVSGVEAIIAAERLRRSRQTGLPDFVKGLIGEG